MSELDERTFTLRPARENDAEEIVRIRFEAFHAAARALYPPDVLQCWAPEPSAARSEELRRALASQQALGVVSEQEGRVVGFGSLVPSSRELRAVYVSPAVARRGIGSRIVAELERWGAARGIGWLELVAPLNAEKFFARQGYASAGRHIERFGAAKLRMACLKMHKELLAASALGREPSASAAHATRASRFLAVHPIGDTDTQALPIREVGPAVGYYTCVLGFTLVSKTSESAVLERDGVRIGLCVNGADPEQASCYFEVSDVPALHRELSEKGIEPSALREEQHGESSQRIFFAKEPFGVCFCFGQTQSSAAKFSS